ncbi:Nucleic acid-binding, OB-fold protein [Metarhizium album ARSEF 1941]|uniref:Nucleic acid-binding, OB-fold protein n=1 Tax=Metarhizium album (strain ARSEF 1941) TaxID=1081103 RepID=A0A0B2X600_METAS|nr:Nucleic acid-binding, OB-fold protein [Metarhizium album ARSEF 1941]KHO01779.1 Nucleic acid-binding, OB-fold protein [Metarhizium album ARSEF 1941]
MPPPRLLLLAGPPPSSTITEASCSVHHFDKPFQDLLALPAAPSREPPPATRYTAWRSLPLLRQPLPTSFSQVHQLRREPLNPPGTATFFTTADTTSPGHGGTADVLAQFCEESLAAHNSTAAPEPDGVGLDWTTHDASSPATTPGLPLPLPHGRRVPPPVPPHLSDLEDVPSAARVAALQPQTVTLNLIAGVLSVARPRTVTTRWGSTLSLVEVLVGDETAAGFAVTFWVPADKAAESDVLKLRRQDVVLMENVALHVFRGKVYGQSLRRGWTRLHLLWRAQGGGLYSTRRLARAGRHENEDENESPQVGKARAVRDWVVRFVGLDGKGGNEDAVDWDRPPDHTQ